MLSSMYLDYTQEILPPSNPSDTQYNYIGNWLYTSTAGFTPEHKKIINLFDDTNSPFGRWSKSQFLRERLLGYF